MNEWMDGEARDRKVYTQKEDVSQIETLGYY